MLAAVWLGLSAQCIPMGGGHGLWCLCSGEASVIGHAQEDQDQRLREETPRSPGCPLGHTHCVLHWCQSKSLPESGLGLVWLGWYGQVQGQAG